MQNKVKQSSNFKKNITGLKTLFSCAGTTNSKPNKTETKLGKLLVSYAGTTNSKPKKAKNNFENHFWKMKG